MMISTRKNFQVRKYKHDAAENINLRKIKYLKVFKVIFSGFIKG